MNPGKTNEVRKEMTKLEEMIEACGIDETFQKVDIPEKGVYIIVIYPSEDMPHEKVEQLQKEGQKEGRRILEWGCGRGTLYTAFIPKTD